VTTHRVRIVLQARTGSRRLPAKALLPVGGLPLAVLCARRLGSTGREVVLATSTDPSDDVLSAVANEHGVRTHRGSLDNVLDRFLECTADLQDADVVVRATADNPIPDGEFVDRLIQALEEGRATYLGCSSPEDGLPYGLSAEVFTAGALRGAARECRDAYTNEHVTPYLRRTAGNAGIVPRGLFFATDRADLRVTIDTLADYLRMAEVFQRAPHAEHASWRTLIELLEQPANPPAVMVAKEVNGQRYSCMTLGTAQLGMDYGITNSVGRPSDSEALAIITSAQQGGITQLDTARAYGDAELRIGLVTRNWAQDRLRIVSKLAPLSALPDATADDEVCRVVDDSVQSSCRDLGRARIDAMLFHRSADMFRWGGVALQRLAQHMGDGTIGQIGVSVYAPDEALRSLEDPRITQLQIPFNLLDQRWFEPKFQQAVVARTNLVIYARSVFLQGLLLSDAAHWPSWAGLAAKLCSSVKRLVTDLDRKNAADLCIAYVRAFPWITSVVVGVESAAQLEELLPLAREKPLDARQIALVRETFEDVPHRLLNPSLW
jgi:spore coat polysaccharide biosynthesis protein SpsF (cytidylyltransferase family)/aryl-alcohol dehydrogenase-like predicted oxidoreductase